MREKVNPALSAEIGRRAALRRFVQAVSPDAIADRRLPASARMLLHILDGPGAPLAGEAGERWCRILQGHLGCAGIRVGALDSPLVWVMAELGELDCLDDRDAIWKWLLDELERL